MNRIPSNAQIESVITAQLLGAAVLAGLNLTPVIDTMSLGQHIHSAGNATVMYLFEPSSDIRVLSGGGNVEDGLTSPLHPRNMWDHVAPALGSIGIDLGRARNIFLLAEDYLSATGHALRDVSTRISVDHEEGVAYAVVRLIVDLDFEAAMELDWAMTEHLVERMEFPERVSISVRDRA